ncbi:T9SS type A sorting domain-containing protein [Dyadobacter sandarakinus]|uniref:T9SS type A sorting domain-containing protein n=2 Tax=Dyadobacter sandarakinus TaxID=2747268 RepID=A0ABX7IEK9_9BACT|nr:T9SS type A sorting domain-containing protein [Dyadobacter sandarakinus]
MAALWVLCAGNTFAQRFYAVVFNQLPRDFQLYARSDNDTATVPIAGIIEAAGWDHMSVVTYRNKEQVAYDSVRLNYGTASSATFQLNPRIKAEMADYDFEVYACKEADSVLVVKRTEVVAGDFYVISGQSNAAAVHFGNWSSKYARTIARMPDASPNVGFGDTLWIASNWSWPYAGAWSVEMQRLILENDSIPTCVINGALPGSYIAGHVDRNANDIANSSLYGLLYRRIKVASPTRIRAFIWYQGEQEALENIQNYQAQYDKLYNYWRGDYPQVEKYIVVQIPVLFNPYYYAGTIREFQRKTKYTYEKTDHFNVMGLPYFDGIHYDIKGYQELGKRFYNYFANTIYRSVNDPNTACPDVRKIYYTSDKRDEITLMYDSLQTLKWPADTLMDDVNNVKFTKSLRDVYFFDGDETRSAGILSGTAQGNIVRLKVAAGTSAEKLTYLPAYKGEKVRVYYGPFLKNSRGLGAFSFQEVPIAAPLVFSVFEAKENLFSTVNVTWASSGADTYVLERKAEDETGFSQLGNFNAATLAYEDKDVVPDVTYIYRIQGFSAAAESVIMTDTIKTAPLLSVEPSQQDLVWQIYPNPAAEQLEISFRNPTTGTVTLANAKGQGVQSKALVAQTSLRLNLSALPAGIYIVSLIQKNGITMSRKLLKK